MSERYDDLLKVRKILIINPLPSGTITQHYGEHPAWYPGYLGHPGMDIWDTFRTPVIAAHDGYAVVVPTPPGKTGKEAGYGNYIYIVGPNYDTLYAHLDEFIVKEGTVKVGQPIGLLGASGWCVSSYEGGKGEHLHFGLRLRGSGYNPRTRGYVDPLPYFVTREQYDQALFQ